MLTLHLMGHAHLAQNSRPLQLPRKALGLLCYLTLEGTPHHREELADLLWEGSGGLLNLRVELTRLRALGLDLFPARQVMLSAALPTDLAGWLSGGATLTDDDLAAWLGALRGPPLAGLDDLGTSRFRVWVDHQRLRIAGILEERCGEVEARLLRQGRRAAAERVRQVAEAAGLILPPPVGHAPELLATQTSALDWAEQAATVRGLMERAHEAPQVLLVWGQRGSARSLLRSAVQDAQARLVQVQYSPQPAHLLHALTQQVRGLLPPGQGGGHGVPLSGVNEEHLLHLATLLGEQGAPLVVALHDVYEAPQWLLDAIGLLMELRLPLLIVVSPTSGVHGGFGLCNVDWSRVHALSLPGLGTTEVRRRLHVAGSTLEAGALQARASEIAQLTEGWPPYVEALLGAADLSPQLPEALGARIRSQLAHLPADTRGGLFRLAQVQDHFTLPVAHALLGEQAHAVLQAARSLGHIGHAAPLEEVSFPALSCVHDDAESHLAFQSEVVRAALAAGLPPGERQQVREHLALLLRDTHPALALYYAERVRRPELAEEVRAALPPSAALHWHGTSPIPLPGAPLAPGAGPQHTLRTPNGYRVSWQGGHLELLRRGWPAPPPQLNLHLGTVGPGRWQVHLRLDVFRAAPRMALSAPPHALGVQVGEGPAQRYAPAPTSATAAPHEARGEYHAGLPLGQDVQLCGHWAGPPGPLVLSVRAVDLACRITSLRWAGEELLAPGAAGHHTLAGRGLLGTPLHFR